MNFKAFEEYEKKKHIDTLRQKNQMHKHFPTLLEGIKNNYYK